MTAQLTSYSENFQVCRDDSSSPTTEVDKLKHPIAISVWRKYSTGDAARKLQPAESQDHLLYLFNVGAQSPVLCPWPSGLYVEIGTAYALGYTIEARLSLGIGDRERT